jgi:hypothetical protein
LGGHRLGVGLRSTRRATTLVKEAVSMAKQTKITIETDSLLILRGEVPCVHGVADVPQKWR